MKPFWLLLLALSAVPLAGCEAVSAIYSATLWVSGLFLVVIIWVIALIRDKGEEPLRVGGIRRNSTRNR